MTTTLMIVSFCIGLCVGAAVLWKSMPKIAESPRRFVQDQTLASVMAAAPAAGEDTAIADLPGDKILAELPDMVVVMGKDRVRRYVSPESKRMLGFTPDEMVAASPISGIHPDDRARTMAASQLMFEGKVDSVLTAYRHRHKDGHYVWLEAHFTLSRDPVTGEAGESIGVVRDITGRAQAEIEQHETAAHLKENNRLLQMAESLTNIGHWRVDVLEGQLVWSDEVYRIHGVAKDYVPNLENALDFYHPEDSQRVRELIEEATATGQAFSFHARIVRPDGEVRHVACIGQTERAPDGRVITLFGIFEDVTSVFLSEKELRMALDAAENAARAKTHFLANMSHEIRNPMNGVIGFADLLLLSDLSEQQADYVRMISESGKAMLRLLNELLDLSKIEAGRMQLTREQVDFAHLVRGSIRLFEPSAKAKGIALETDVAPDLGHRWGDKLRIRQIILNLVGNAIKFTETGSVRVESLARDGAVIVRVIDTGPGIPKDKLETVFDEFSQVRNVTPGADHGSGLGLTIARQLAALMGGTITVESEFGKGSTFEASFPLERVAIGAVTTDTPEPTRLLDYRRVIEGRRILLVDDSDINRILAGELLRRLGAVVEIAEDGVIAVQRIEAAQGSEYRFDLVLMDMQMPRLGGIEATQAVRSKGISPEQLPIIALTANAYADDIQLCLRAGMQDHITKPISADGLAATLSKWLTNSSGEDKRSAAPVAEPQVSATLLYQERLARLRTRVQGIASAGTCVSEFKETIQDEVHILAGIASYFGHARLGEFARELDTALRASSDDAETRAKFTRFAQALEATR